MILNLSLLIIEKSENYFTCYIKIPGKLFLLSYFSLNLLVTRLHKRSIMFD